MKHLALLLLGGYVHANNVEPLATEVEMPEATAPCDKQGEGVDIFVLDTGVECGHKDLADRCVTIDANLETADPLLADELGQGTHVASIIAGTASGTAKKARVFSAKVIDSRGVVLADSVLRALKNVSATVKVTRRPSLVVMAWTSVTQMPALHGVVDDLLRRNVPVIAAAGANSCGDFPNRAFSVITVDSHTQAMEPMRSLPCPEVDLYALGEEVVGASHVNTVGTVTRSGVAQATAAVAGAVAWYLGEHTDATLTPLDIKAWLADGASNGILSAGTPNKVLTVPCSSATSGSGTVMPTRATCQNEMEALNTAGAHGTGDVMYSSHRSDMKCWSIECTGTVVITIKQLDGSTHTDFLSVSELATTRPVWSGHSVNGSQEVPVRSSALMYMETSDLGLGMDLSFTWSCETPSGPACSRQSSGGEVTYPEDNNRYTPFDGACWLLECEEAQHVVVEWQYFDLHTEPGHHVGDVLKIGDLKQDNYNRLTGSGVLPPQSYGSVANLFFGSSYWAAGSGFRLTWTCGAPLPREDAVPVVLPTQDRGDVVVTEPGAVVHPVGSDVELYELKCPDALTAYVFNTKFHVAYGEQVAILGDDTNHVLPPGPTSLPVLSSPERLHLGLYTGDKQPVLTTFSLNFTCMAACREAELGANVLEDDGECITLNATGLCEDGVSFVVIVEGQAVIVDEDNGKGVLQSGGDDLSVYSSRTTGVVRVEGHGTVIVDTTCDRHGICDKLPGAEGTLSVSRSNALTSACWSIQCEEGNVLAEFLAVGEGFSSSALGGTGSLLQHVTHPGVLYPGTGDVLFEKPTAEFQIQYSCLCEELSGALLYPRSGSDEQTCFVINCSEEVSLSYTAAGESNSMVLRDAMGTVHTVSEAGVARLVGPVSVRLSMPNRPATGSFKVEWQCGAPVTPPETEAPSCTPVEEHSGVLAVESQGCWALDSCKGRQVAVNVTYKLPTGATAYAGETLFEGEGSSYLVLSALQDAWTLRVSGEGAVRTMFHWSCDCQHLVTPGVVTRGANDVAHCWEVDCGYGVPMTITHEGGVPLVVANNKTSTPISSADPVADAWHLDVVSLDAQANGEAAFSWTCDYSSKVVIPEHCGGRYTVYDKEGNEGYGDNAERCWKVACGAAHKDIVMWYNLEEGYDFVEIYPAHSGVPVDRFTGTGNAAITYPYPVVVKAAFDATVNSFLHLDWACYAEEKPREAEVSPSLIVPPVWEKSERNCYHTFETEVDYPHGPASYNPLKNVCWHLKCDKAATVSFFFLDLEAVHDTVTVYSGNGDYLGVVAQGGPAQMQVTGDVFLNFRSDSSVEKKGFVFSHLCGDETLAPTGAPPTPAPTGGRLVVLRLTVTSSTLGQVMGARENLAGALEMLYGQEAVPWKVCHMTLSGAVWVVGDDCMFFGSREVSPLVAARLAVFVNQTVGAGISNERVEELARGSASTLGTAMGGEVVDVVADPEAPVVPVPASDDSSDSLPTGVIVAIVFGSLVVLAAAAFGLYYCCKEKEGTTEPTNNLATTVV